jgi:Peptidase family M28
LADRELDMLRDALRKHVKALAVDIGPRTPGIIGNWRSLRFGRSVLRGFRKNTDLAVESLFLPFDGRILPETRMSDHASFWDAGLPALMVTDTAFFRNPNYHLASDTIDTLDFAFMAELVQSLELALLELPPPSSKP